MVREFKMEPGRVWGKKDADYFFDTDAYPLQYTDSVLIVTGHTLTFPDVRKGNAYNWQQWDSGNSNNDPRESAISAITMVDQEWGPASTSPTDSGTQLDDTVLGTVPAGADHILVRVKTTRTTNPSQINGNTIPPEPEPGQWTIAYGGTLLFEQLYPLARMIYVYLAATDNGDGTRNVMLRRLQSVTRQRGSFYRSGNDYSKTGWNYGGTYGSAYGILVAQRDTKGPTTDVTGIGGRFRRTGASPAATSDTTNYSSVYTVDFEIIPGRANITPVNGSGGTSAYYGIADEVFSETAGTTHTQTADFGAADATRKIIVGFVSINQTNSSRDVSSVTIGGVTATQVAYRKSTNGTNVVLSAIYIANVPTGTSGNIVVTHTGSVATCSMTVLAGYNMNSSSPDATISSGTANSNTNLTTVDGGVAIAVGLNLSSNWGNIEYYQTPYDRFWVQGLDNPTLWPTVPSSGGGNAYARNFQTTDGSTEVLKSNYLSAAAGNPPITPAVCSWAAASFH